MYGLGNNAGVCLAIHLPIVQLFYEKRDGRVGARLRMIPKFEICGDMSSIYTSSF
jgi:hypothetical protein